MNIPVDLTSKDLEDVLGSCKFIVSKAELVMSEENPQVIEAVKLGLILQSDVYNGRPFSHRLNVPKATDTQQDAWRKKKFLQAACNYFHIPMSAEGFDYQAFIGKSGEGMFAVKSGYNNLVAWV